MEPVIKVAGLGKQYTLGKAKTDRKTLGATLGGMVTGPLRSLRGKLRGGASAESETKSFWALKDVNFEIMPGEVVGIIGRNGAGKSTLLKILSRITDPTEGEIDITGRVGSLLEVGTGFHPELTGRENVYLNGAILGMKKAEIAKKFDEIVAFAETEKFLDTPVKYYSSGMYTRLAFAVAAHLDPEILIVDEVLAVGDAEFQKKCMGKMGEVAHEGRTVLFVSHNLNAVDQLCNSVVVMERGRVKARSVDVSGAVRGYLQADGSSGGQAWERRGAACENAYFVPSKFFVAHEDGTPLGAIHPNDEEIWVHIQGEMESTDPGLTIGYALFAEDGTCFYWSYPTDGPTDKWLPRPLGKYSVRSRIPPRFLNEGTYRLELIGGLTFRDWIFKPGESPASIELKIQGGLSESPLWMARRPGLLAPVMEWTLA
jgi:lipopolysaccharide transport system ATP-binding protein